MPTVPDLMTPEVAGDALERLRDEQQQIQELFETWARHRRSAGDGVAESERLATLIFTLLRVHQALEADVLQPALAAAVGADHPALARAAERRGAVADAIERVESLSPRDPDFAREMNQLALRARGWFDADEHGLFALARDALPDRAALDRTLAARQEALLAAGPVR